MKTIINIALFIAYIYLLWITIRFFISERNHVKKLKEMKKESDKKDGRTHV